MFFSNGPQFVYDRNKYIHHPVGENNCVAEMIQRMMAYYLTPCFLASPFLFVIDFSQGWTIKQLPRR